MPVGAGQPGPESALPVSQTGNGEVKSSIPGVSPELFKTLSQRHAPEFIQEQRAKYPTHEAFLKDAEKEAEHIRFTLAKQDASGAQNLNPKPLVVGQKVNGKIVDKDVLENAQLWDTKRQEAAAKLLYGGGKELSDKQKRELIEAHWEAAGEKGEDEEHLAGVYNLTREQISREVRKLSSFTKEERRQLFEAGLVGILPPTTFAGFDKAPYVGTDLEPAIDEILDVGMNNGADEVYLQGMIGYIRGLVADKKAPAALARDLVRAVNDWRITAEQPPAPPAPPTRPRSGFDRITDRLENARRAGNRTAEQAEINIIKILFREIDALRKPNGEKIDLFKVARDPLVKLFYDSRVGVGQKEKLGIDEYREQGVLDRLTTLQQALNPNVVVEDHTGRVQQIVHNSKIFLGEGQGYWNSPDIAAIENMPDIVAFKQRWGINTLEEGIGGCIDYFNREGLNMIATVVNERKAVLADNGIHDIWDTVVRNKMGRPLKDDDGVIRAQNFADVREIIEGARCQDPWIPNRGDYETWIQFVADDTGELRLMAPHIIIKVLRKLGTGEEQSAYQTLTQEKEKMDKGLAVYPFETEGEFRRAKSEITGDFNLQGDNIFSDRVRKGWDGFFHFSEFIASSCQDTEFQDHFADAVLLDENGETMLALEEFSKDDGIFWRYGEKSVDTATKTNNVADLQRWQKRRRKDIENSLMSKKLRGMDDLLNLTLDQQGNITGYGIPKHPAFQRLKAKYDSEDQADITQYGHIRDADRNRHPTQEKRWAEYCRKALLWQQTGEFGDPRESERVTFQHPLARVLRPVGYKDAQGRVTAVDELYDMFESDSRINTDSAYKRAKRRRIKNTLDKAEKVARAFLVDSMSALAWFTPEVRDENDNIDAAKTQEMVDKFNQFLVPAGEPPITATETVPYKKLYRVIMQALLREDQNKLPAKKRFKYHYLLSKMGFDLDLPTFAAWNLGTHDTGRPALMLDSVYKDNQPDGLAEALKASKKLGLDEKNTGARWAEEERRMHLLAQLVMRQMFPKYFNYPGHDTKGAGVKDIRNILDPIFGISRGTSWISDLTDKMLMGEQDPAKDYGCSRSPLRQWLGLVKGGDEVIFRQTGYAGVIEGPRDMEAWVNRFKKVVEKYEGMTKGSKEGGPGILKGGPFSGMYYWRHFSWGGLKAGEHWMADHQKDKTYAIDNPKDALESITQDHYRAGIELAGKTAAPLIAHMKQTVESTFGRNPESAKFLNTLFWYAVSNWMDTSWEYRAKPGYAVDGNLPLARTFIATVLREDEGLIYSDAEWDQIMLGTTKIPNGTRVTRYQEQNNNGVKQVLTDQGKWENCSDDEDGYIDSFPKEIRDAILKGQEKEVKNGKGEVVYTYKTYMLPFGLNSDYPETMATYYDPREKGSVVRDYKGALQNIKPRKQVTRL